MTSGDHRYCPFGCGKLCKNKQAVRSHLRDCPNYTPRRRPHVAYQHGCGAVYVSGCDQPPRRCPGCSEDITETTWERLGETEYGVGVVEEGEVVEIKG